MASVRNSFFPQINYGRTARLTYHLYAGLKNVLTAREEHTLEEQLPL